MTSMSAFAFLSRVTPPKATGSQREWQNYLSNTTEKREGVADLSKAKIICLGDVHTEGWQHKWRGSLIDRFGSDGDIVLCEGYTALQKIAQSSGRFESHKKLICYGWDNLDFALLQRDELMAMNKLQTKYKENAPSSRWSRGDIETWQSLNKAAEAHHLLRTNELVKTANVFAEHLLPGQRIFIVSGSDHLLYKFTDPAYDSYEFNIVKSLKTYATALLLPTQFHTQAFDDEKAYLKKLKST
jgi:hypothetical protein